MLFTKKIYRPDEQKIPKHLRGTVSDFKLSANESDAEKEKAHLRTFLQEKKNVCV